MTAIPIQPAPIACTLSPEDFKRRSQWLRELADRALLHHRTDGASVTLVYRPSALDEIEELVRRERSCCAFLDFALERTDQKVVLTITAPPEAGDDARLLFAHLVPTEAGRAST